MVRTIIKHMLMRRYFWRDTGFDGLSELYLSIAFRSMAIGLTGVFVPVYMYQLGYSIAAICSVYAWFATVQIVTGVGVGYIVAKIGPKHTIFLSYVMQFLSAMLFVGLDDHHLPAFLLGGLWGLAANLFFVPYHVAFSKIKHTEHSGKEVSHMIIMQKVGLALGPLIGGLVATLFGAQYTFLVAGLLLLAGMVPLLHSGEPVKVGQRLDFKNFRVDHNVRDFVSYAGYAAEDILTKLVWPAYLGIFVLGTAVYAKLGALAGVSVIVSIAITYMLGAVTDRRNARRLLQTSVLANALLHLVRPLTTNIGVAFGVNAANDAVTAGYTLPYLKGYYAAADDLPGHRIVYVVSMETVGHMGRALACWLMVLVAVSVSTWTTLFVGFMLAALASLLIMAEKFKVLRPRAL